MDSHDLDGPAGDGPGLALPCSALLEGRDVVQECAHADQLAGVGVVEELVHVSHGAALAGAQEGGTVVGGVQEGLEQVGYGRATGRIMETLDEGHGPGCALLGASGEAHLTPAEIMPEGRGGLPPALQV